MISRPSTRADCAQNRQNTHTHTQRRLLHIPLDIGRRVTVIVQVADNVGILKGGRVPWSAANPDSASQHLGSHEGATPRHRWAARQAKETYMHNGAVSGLLGSLLLGRRLSRITHGDECKWGGSQGKTTRQNEGPLCARECVMQVRRRCGAVSKLSHDMRDLLPG